MSEPEEKMAELEKQFERHEPDEVRGETWKPAIGEVLSGSVVAKRTVNVAGRDAQLIVVETKNGYLVTVWNSKVLNPLFDKVEVGSAVAIKYLGKLRSKTTGAWYKNYVFEVV